MTGMRWTADELDVKVKRGDVKIVGARLVQRGMDGEPEQKHATAANRAAKAERLLQQPESAVLRECSELLERHLAIALWWRANSGGVKTEHGYVKFNFVGCSDLMAMSTHGRFLAIECKATGKKASPDQQSFLDNVNASGGLGVCVDHVGKLALALMEL